MFEFETKKQEREIKTLNSEEALKKQRNTAVKGGPKKTINLYF